jgi:26S proteasome regulatory subunit T5
VILQGFYLKFPTKITAQFSPKVKVICATNRPDALDPALLRSGRLDRKIELPHPNEDARAKIMQIHSRRMNVNKDDVNYQELARATEDFNGKVTTYYSLG